MLGIVSGAGDIKMSRIRSHDVLGLMEEIGKQLITI